MMVRFPVVLFAREPPVPRPVPSSQQHLSLLDSNSAAATLMAAITTLSRRGVGQQAWVASYQHDPIAFLIDAVSSPVRLWSASGELMFANYAAEQLGVPAPVGGLRTGTSVSVRGLTLERRVLTFFRGSERFILEVLIER